MKNRPNNESTELSLHARFLELWQRCLNPASTSNAEHVYQNLLARYSTPDRYYHDLNHLLHCLEQLDLVSYLIPQPDRVEMALWFHDAVYKPGNSDNEQNSTELFLSSADNCFTEEFNKKVKDLILITAHKDVPKDEDERFIVDIDLSSFGSDWNHFLIDTGNLRKEQINVSDSVYVQAHTRFLKYLLARERIFYTDFFYIRYEHIALQNIAHLLAKRRSQGYE